MLLLLFCHFVFFTTFPFANDTPFKGVLHAEADWGAGTTEYALDALKAAAEGGSYSCPIERGVTLPMIFAPDLVDCLLRLARAPAGSLREKERGYCAAGFSFAPEELAAEVARRERYKGFTMVLPEDNKAKGYFLFCLASA